METQNNSFSIRKILNSLFTVSFSCTSKKNIDDITINIAIGENANPVSETPEVDIKIVIENEVVTEDTNVDTVVTETIVTEK